ncbi:MAG: molecular chaperone DnaK [Deltaproteobacteria bacterium]|nr:molecular chaperone DnaK [Deltaproteobacteria bacterium]
MAKIIGIDLGTTNSVVSVMESGEPKVITNEEGGRTTPSVVAFENNGNVLVGQQARRQAITNPDNTVFSAKRFIGRRHEELGDDVDRVPYEVERSSSGGVQFVVQGKPISAPEVSARILGKLKKAAEDYLGESVSRAVITVPAYFNDAQRQATKDAGRIAGLEVERIVNEPTAAALAYAHSRAKGDQERLVAVYDLGGGTFDISLLEVSGEVVEVVATGGDTRLGGDDFDDRVMQWLLEAFRKDTGLDVSSDKLVLQRLKDAAEKAKIELSLQPETEINLPFLTADATGPKHLQVKLSRAKFEDLVGDLVTRSLEPCKRVLADAGKTAADVDEVLLVGGSTRTPLVQREVEALFGKAPSKAVNPDEVVALGAAVQGGVLGGEVTDMLLVDVTPLSLGIETLGGVMTVLIPRNTTIPTRKAEVFTTAADNQASVQVHVLQGERKMSGDNRTLAKFGLEGIAPAPRGTPQVEVSFDIDANGIVHVSAKDQATGKEHKVEITASSGLDEAEIERMIDDAKKNEAADEERRQAVERRNGLEALVLQTEAMLASEAGARVSGSDATELREAVDEAKQSLESGDDAAVSAAHERLTTVSHRVAQAMYADGQAGAANPEAPTAEDDAANDHPDDVIDAEFEEKAS